MMDDLISRKSLLECAEYDDKGRLVIPYRKVKNALTAFDKERVINEIHIASAGIVVNMNVSSSYAEGYIDAAKAIIEIVKRGGIE